jgi:soluble lytic murein transglycosylase-like protein
MGQRTLLLVIFFGMLFWSDAEAGKIYYYKDKDGIIRFTNVPDDKGRLKLFAVYRDLDADEKVRIHAYIDKAAERHDLDADLIRAVVQAESDFDVDAVSHAGAEGLMQIMPETGKDLGLDEPFDAEANIEAGVKYLKIQMEEFKDLTLALAAYNAGPHKVKKYRGMPPYAETRGYVAKVMKTYERLKSRRK